MRLNIEQFRLTEPMAIQRNRKPKRVSSQLFLRGPIPINWLEQAAKLSASCFMVGVCLWWIRGLESGAPVKLTRTRLSRFNLKNRNTVSRALRKLETAGLISVERKCGRSPIVQIRLEEEFSDSSEIESRTP